MSQKRETLAKEFYRRLVSLVLVSSLATLAIISGYLVVLLRLPAEQWRGFGMIVAILFVLLFGISLTLNQRFISAILHFLEARERGEESVEGLRAAFAALSRLPLAQFGMAVTWWAIGGILVAAAMLVAFETFGSFQALVMVLAAASGGFVTSIFLYFSVKRLFSDLVRELAAAIGSPAERAALVRVIPLRQKLLVSVFGVTAVTVTFAMFLAVVSANRRLEANVSQLQSVFLGDALSRGAALGVFGWREADERARALGIANDLMVVNAETGEVEAGNPDRLYPEELAYLLSHGSEGDGIAIDSPNSFSWRSSSDGKRRYVAATAWTESNSSSTRVIWIFALVLGASTAVAYGLSRALARDIGNATDDLQRQVARLAAGDLRGSQVFESEDELGLLARSFESMRSSLRETVRGVVEAADAVEGTGSRIAHDASAAAQGAVEQSRGVSEAGRLMDSVNTRVAEVSEASHGLDQLVEESSSSILEMGAAGEELNDTAGVLSSKVDEVSDSIEQMVRSVKQVSSTTESLSDSSVETSSSMEEMASAMRQVDVTAAETAMISKGVIESADKGRERVRQTIEGMEVIRVATDTAETVIRGLGSRTQEIGAILDVIDDVADETNLLALNAAIIAAQAGEHGRAFSVVADEIKELADRVLASTKEIGGLIRAVQSESEKAVGAIADGSRSVASGVSLSMEAGAALEEITGASRDSGERIHEIVQAVREQTKAASHVVNLMDRVNQAVHEIKSATAEQDRGNEVVFRSQFAMREVAQQLRTTTEEQARGGARIRESIDGVRSAAEAIGRAIHAQSTSNGELTIFLERVSAESVSSEESARRMEEASTDLSSQSQILRESVRKFEL